MRWPRGREELAQLEEGLEAAVAGGAQREEEAGSLGFTHSAVGTYGGPKAKEWYLTAVRGSDQGKRGTQGEPLEGCSWGPGEGEKGGGDDGGIQD